MSAWEETIARLTDRLRPDPELQRDVAQELRAHLEDSAASFSAGGAGEEEAAAEALKALGDVNELSEQLWQANRRRMRIRGVIRWAAGAALLPAAIATVLILGISLSGFPALPSCFWETEAGTSADLDWAKSLPEDKQFLLRGDANARTPTERAKTISDRWPDNPVYYGNYVQTLMAEPNSPFYSRLRPFPERLSEMLAVLDRGEKLDRENAFYPLHKAAWLFAASCDLSEEEPASRPEEEARDSNLPSRSTWDLQVKDANLFQRGLMEFDKAVASGRFLNRAVDMIEIRQEVVPPPTSLLDLIRKADLGELGTGAWMAGWGSYRQLTRIVCAHAVRLAKAGDPAALHWAQSALIMSDKIGAEEPTIIGELVALATRSLALGTRWEVCDLLGDKALAEASASAQAEEHRSFLAHLRGPRTGLKHTGLWWHLQSGPFADENIVNYEPMRTVEGYVAFQAGLLALLAVFTATAAILGALSLLGRFRRQRDRRPILLFVGWGRLGRICLWSIVVPLAALAGYEGWQFAREGAFGLNYAGGRILVETAAAGSIMFILLVGLSYSAIRRRAAEIGLETPPPIRLRRRIISAGFGAIVLAAILVYVIGWWAGPFRPADIPSGTAPEDFFAPLMAALQGWGMTTASMILAGVAVAATLAWAVRELVGLAIRRTYAPFRGTLWRSLVPVLCAAVVLLGVVCGVSLRLGERSAAGRVKGDAWMDLSNEVDLSGFRIVRHRFTHWYEQDRKEQSQTQPAATQTSTSQTGADDPGAGGLGRETGAPQSDSSRLGHTGNGGGAAGPRASQSGVWAAALHICRRAGCAMSHDD